MANLVRTQSYFAGVLSRYNLARIAPQQESESRVGELLTATGIRPIFYLSSGSGTSGSDLTVFGGTSLWDKIVEYQEENRKNNRASNAACIGGMLLIIGSAGLALVTNHWNEISKSLEEAREYEALDLPCLAEGENKVELTRIVKSDIRILEKQNLRARNIVLLTATALASAATAFAAGMCAVQWLITASIVVGVVTVAVGVFLAVTYSLQKTETPNGVIEYLRKHPELEIHI